MNKFPVTESILKEDSIDNAVLVYKQLDNLSQLVQNLSAKRISIQLAKNLAEKAKQVFITIKDIKEKVKQRVEADYEEGKTLK